MTTLTHRCRNCGYALEVHDASLCLPCLLAEAKSKMSVGPLGHGVDEKESDERRPNKVQQVPKKSMSEIKNWSAKLKNEKTKSGGGSVRVYQPQRLSRISNGLHCVLCGAKIAFGEMLAHKENVHGEARVSRSQTRSTAGKSVWVSVFQGGLPGLGKRR